MPLPTKKRTRKTHKDKDIEAVLLLKDKWNLQVSYFIYDLVALKRGMNGRGDAEHRLPPSRITDKLDGSIATLLNRMTGQYREIAQNGLTIVKKQEELNRLKGKIKSPESSSAKPVSMFQQLLNEPSAPPTRAAEFKPELITEATNPFTRAIFKMRTPISNQPGRRTLQDLLFSFLDARNEVEDMQDAAVTKGPEGLVRVEKSFEEFRRTLTIINNLYNQYAKEIGKGPASSTFSQESAYQSNFNEYKREFLIADSISGTSHSFKTRFGSLSKAFDHAKNDIDRADILNKISDLHRELIQYYRNGFQLRVNKPWKTISELYTLGPVPLPPDGLAGLASLQTDKLQALAHNIFTRLIKKKRVSLTGSGDGFTSTRLQLFEVLAKCRETLTASMDAIESGQDHALVGGKVNEIKSYFDEIRSLLKTMNIGIIK